MSQNKQGLINHLIKFGKTDQFSWDEISSNFGYTGEQGRDIWRKYRRKNNLLNTKEEQIQNEGIIEQHTNNEKGSNEIKFIHTKEALTDEEIYKECKIDPNNWKLTQVWHKKRSTGFIYSANFKLIPKDSLDVLGKVLENYKTEFIPIRKSDFIQNDKYSSPSCVLLSLPDLHLDKATVDGNTITQSIINYEKVLDNLLHKCYSSHFIDEIVFVLGNDYFHTDSLHNTTTKGTPLFVNTDWDKAYEEGFKLMVKCIGKLKQFCNKLNIILIPGNHSITKEFYLAHALEIYFKSDKNIIFDRTKLDQKIYNYGETLLCFSHGNNVNEKLPLIFATSFYTEWGKSKYKEIILGDKHHNTEKIISSQGEIAGVRMRILPSLSGTDQWHQDNLFMNSIQSGIAIVYDIDKGRISEFEERI